MNTNRCTFETSVISYPERGMDGRSDFRGNVSGKVIEAFLRGFHPNPRDLFVDPCEGSATSRDVAARLGIRYQGFDLRSGFDITMHDLLAALQGERPSSAFMHLPYWFMIRYSEDPRDLSNAATLEAFLELAQLSAMNVYDALCPGGHYAFLMGNLRHKGNYYPLAAMLELIIPGTLREELIKIQHNTWSCRQAYSGRFIPIAHEKLLILQKTAVKFALDFTIEESLLLMTLKNATWRNLIRRAFMHRSGQALSLQEIYDFVEGTPKARSNPHWREKVRQVLREYSQIFRAIERGQYALQGVC